MDKEKETLQEVEETEQQTEETTLDIAAVLESPEFKAVIDEQVKAGVKEALKGKTPKANTTPPSTIQQSDFDKMTYRERLQFFQSNPHTYNKLVKEG
ncbi:MAG: hypothetical protein FWG63_03940 [Defluviitaleaceae bacterium]|nr:hypothetical protein [Defluviitaleaceae bacterium]